jgi:hypothetical protein
MSENFIQFLKSNFRRSVNSECKSLRPEHVQPRHGVAPSLFHLDLISRSAQRTLNRSFDNNNTNDYVVGDDYYDRKRSSTGNGDNLFVDSRNDGNDDR